ncbi:YCF48-related protein [Pelomonas sp. APW6]|uniref:YCF48-related protein n=1 Tax=Roseateles subflavus TaxID=3053353 RepID=A0ABT7LCV0_9BURK|nr:YCF48-related protein [Pelomonas sp. APW6]MDL5030696.1 YCF48-related protein [Pelomonas sp. APW6]
MTAMLAGLAACGGGSDSQPVLEVSLPSSVSLEVPALSDLSRPLVVSSNVMAQAGLSFAWQFGDGSSGSGAQAQHQYTVPGDYVVKLTISNAAGQSIEQRGNVSIERTAALKALSCSKADGRGWCWQSGRISNKALLDAYFASETLGWVVGDGGEIWRTTDGGATWAQRPSPTSNALKSVTGRGPQTLWVTDWTSTWTSSDGGEHWTAVPSAPNGRVALVGAPKGIYAYSTVCSTKFCDYSSAYSPDDGQSWIDFGLRSVSVAPGGALWRLEVSGGSNLFGGVPGDKGDVQVSRDAGKTWVRVLASSPDRFGALKVLDDLHVVAKTWTGQAWSPDPGSELWSQTRDGGASWEACQPSGGPVVCMSRTEPEQTAVSGAFVLGQFLQSDPRGRSKDFRLSASRQFSLTRQELRRSDDGGLQWTRAFGPRGAGQVAEVAALSDRVLLQVRAESVLRSSNGGQDWTEVLPLGPPTFSQRLAQLQALRNGVVWLLSDTQVWRSADGGQTWQKPDAPYVNWDALRFNDDGQTGWAVFLGRVFKTTDGGTSWSYVSVLPDGAPGELTVLNTQRLLARTGTSLLLSEDAGQTWQQVWQTPRAFTVSLSAVKPLGPGSLMAVGSRNTVLLSQDGGRTWQALALAADAGTQWLSVESVDGKTIWIGGSQGELMRSLDAGKTWGAVASGTTDALSRIQFVDAKTGWIATPEGLLATGSGG